MRLETLHGIRTGFVKHRYREVRRKIILREDYSEQFFFETMAEESAKIPTSVASAATLSSISTNKCSRTYPSSPNATFLMVTISFCGGTNGARRATAKEDHPSSNRRWPARGTSRIHEMENGGGIRLLPGC